MNAFPSVTVGRHAGRPAICIDGQPIPCVAYSPVSCRRPELMRKQIARFVPHGPLIWLVTVPAARVDGDWAANPFWQGDTVAASPVLPAHGDLDQICGEILAQDPAGWILIRFGPNEPASWRALHPEDQFTTVHGERLETPSLASTAWVDTSANFGAAVVRWCEDRPWASRLIGFWFGQRTEGTHWPVAQGWLIDSSPVMRARWTAHLRDRYGDEAQLRAAWGDDTLTFATAPLPEDPLRGDGRVVAATPFIQAAADNVRLRDWWLLQRSLFMAMTDVHARALRAASGSRRRLLVFDTLKQTMAGWHNLGFFDPRAAWPSQWSDEQSGSGQVGVAELLDHPDIDGLITPHDYQRRGVGGVYEPEGSADSCVQRGKLFLCEMDTRTDAGDDPCFPARGVAEFAAITWRNLATSWTRGFHSYWMDVYQDWFTEPCHAVIAAQVRAMRAEHDRERAPLPGIAVVLDDRAVLATSGSGHVANELVGWEWRAGLAHCGVPYRVHLLDDLARGDLPPARVWYFPNLYAVDEARLARIAQVVRRAGAVAVWGPGCGTLHDGVLGTAGFTALTGFAGRLDGPNRQRRVFITDWSHPITRDLPGDAQLGGPLAFGPIVLPEDGQRLGEAWGAGGRRLGGLAVRTFGRGPGVDGGDGDWASISVAAGPVPAALWRSIARWAGAHVWCASEDVVVADSSLVAVHAVKPGARRLELPGPCRVQDVVAGRDLPGLHRHLDLVVEGPMTGVWRYVRHE